MKRSIIPILVTLAVSFCNAQYTEFKIHSNGLIYDSATMNYLGSIVDSLNLKFRSCELTQEYYSQVQGLATFIFIQDEVQFARQAIEGNIDLEEFKKLFPKARIDENVFIVKTKYTDSYRDKERIHYSNLLNYYSLTEVNADLDISNRPENDKTSGWVMNANENKLEAFYLHELSKQPIPLQYARLIQYVDCMVDTSTGVYFSNVSDEFNFFRDVKPNVDAYKFLEFAKKWPNEPNLPNFNSKKIEALYSEYKKKYNLWDSLRLVDLDRRMQTDKGQYWLNMLSKAKDLELDSGNSTMELEFYVERYLSKEDALELKRSHIIRGSCSQDPSPRLQALSICRLAAETRKWDIFLRTHLNILNDNFSRITDGSYAWGYRKTYLKELEELNIQAIDLLIGSCLQATNTCKNHYSSSAYRIGRALADIKDKDSLELRLLTMVHDESLDSYNRLIAASIFYSYNYEMGDTLRKETNLKKINIEIERWPTSLVTVWKRHLEEN